MKKTFTILIIAVCCNGFSQAKKVDSLAVVVLDRMSDVIGDLNSCSFNLSTSYDELGEYGLEKKFSENEVLFKGPDKMLVQAKGHDFHKGYWYNGKHIAYYSYSQNNYSIIDAPDNIIATIDAVHEGYDVDFPAADFFYPTFTDDVLANFTTVTFLGKKQIDGKDCFHVIADSPTRALQVWISDDAYNLPVRFLIVYKDKANSPQYMATFSAWKINPDLPDALFEFNPPPQAKEIVMIDKSTRKQ